MRRVLAVALSAALVGSGLEAVVATAAPLPPANPPEAVQDTERPDLVSAQITARMSGHRVEITGQRTESTTTYANPDGTLTTEITAGPVRVARDGGWVPVDLTLERGSDGKVRPKAAPAELVFGGAGSTELAKISGEGRSVAYDWPAGLPEPVLAGDTATYVAVLPGTDLQVKAVRTGFEQALILRERPSEPLNVRIPVRLAGLTLSERTGGELELKDTAGEQVALAPPPLMWGGTKDAAGDPTRSAQIATTVEPAPGGATIVLAPDPAFLADPSVTLPITVDPSTHLTQTADTFVHTNSTTAFGTWTELRVGQSGGVSYRSFLKFTTTPLVGKHILSATLALKQWFAPACTAKESRIYALTGNFSDNTTWANQPGSNPTMYGSTTAVYGATGCTSNWVNYNLTTLVQSWADQTLSNYGVLVRAANEADTNAYWRFYSANYSDNAQLPSLAVSYNSYPSVPSSRLVSPCQTGCSATGASVSSTTPTFKATSTDPDGGTVRVDFEVRNSAETSVIASGQGGWRASPSTGSWTVGSGLLTAGTTYKWRTRAGDGVDWSGTANSGWSPYYSFTVDTTAPSAPTLSSAGFPSGSWSGAHGDDGTFSITPVGGDTTGYLYGLDVNPPTTFTSGTSIAWNDMAEGPHTLHVRTVDHAGNYSTVTSYAFKVGEAAITGPELGATTDNRFTLTAATDPAYTSLTWKWRRGAADAWTTMTGLTDSNGNPLANPLTVTSGSVPSASWAATTAGADGPIDVMAEASNGGTPAPTQPRQLKLNRAEFGGSTATEQVGPATVNLLTGNASLSATDVSVDAYGSDLTVSRTYNSRDPLAGSTGPFGPGWTASLPVETAGSDYTGLTASGSLVTVGLGDVDVLQFTKNANGSYTPEVGAEDYTLTYTAGPPAKYELTDVDGNVTTFTVPSGASDFKPTGVKQAGDPSSTTYDWETIGGVTRIKRMLAPSPTGVTCSTGSYNVRGCRSLGFDYATSTGTAPGDYTGRLRRVSVTAWDPDLGTPAMATVDIAAFDYDANGRLHAAWDPRLGTPLKTVYGYDTDGHVTTITPPGEEAWTLNYGTISGDSDTGRLLSASRPTLSTPSTATTTVKYGIPLSGTGSPYDMSSGQLDRTGQVDRPVDATAIFPPTRVPSGTPTATDYEYAIVHYLDTEGREVNTATPGGGITTTDYDAFGNVGLTLGAANRLRALDASATDSTSAEATLAETLSTTNVYSADGLDLLQSYGPEHSMFVPTLGVVRGRAHTVNVYDEGALPSGTRYHQVTTSTTSARVAGADYDARVSKTAFATQTDWERRTPTSSVQDHGGLALTSRTAYNSDGLVTKTTLPAGTVSQNDARTTEVLYYTAGTHPTDTACGNRAEWVNLVCSPRLAAQPTGIVTERPKIATAYLTYDMFNQVRVKTEKTDGTTHRTTTTTYDGAGRVWKTSVTASTGTALDTVENVYSTTTGQVVESRTITGGGTEIDDVVRGYDTLGRLTSYTDADGNVSTTTYDAYSRPTGSDDGKGTQTRTFDDKRGLVTQLVDSHAGTFTATYDIEGAATVVAYPNGVEARTTYEETGSPTDLDYVKTSSCVDGACVWLSEHVDEDVHGHWITHGSTLSDQTFGYDGVGRLTSVQDTVGDECITRLYTVDANSNRTQLATYDPANDGTCQQTTATSTVSYTHDEADRLKDTGYAYDALGRTTTVPAAGAGGTTLTATYHVNDLVRSLTQGSTTKTWTLDVIQNRFRSWTDGTTSHTNHYAGDADSPSWVTEGGSAWTRNIVGIGGHLTAIRDSVAATELQLVNLHGDVAATASTSAAAGPLDTFDATEFGIPREGDVRRYGWLGANTRSADAVGGLVLMGVRLHNPLTGRFTSVDPVFGGSANAYDYARHDPTNLFDLKGRAVDSGGGGGRKGFRDWKVHCGRITCSLYLSRARTRSVANRINEYGLGWAALSLAVCGGVTGPAALACGAVMITYGYVFQNRVTSAAKNRRCLKITWSILTLHPIVISTNNSGHCQLHYY